MRINKYNGSFLLLISLSLITGFIALALFTKTLPLFAAKTLYFCQQFVSNTLFQIPHTLPNTLVITLGTAILLGALSFFIQLWKTQRLVKGLLIKHVTISKKTESMIVTLGLKNRVHLVEDTNLFSFCSGILSPSIIITTGLVSSLNDKELEAVFLHEKAHLQSHDPLKIILGKTISWVFFFLPIFSELNKNIVASSELLADRFVINSQQGTMYLKGALRKILITPQVALATVPAIANPDHLEMRIHRLINPAARYNNFGVSIRSILISVAFFVTSLFLLQTPVNAFQMDAHMESSPEPSYFLCSSDNACRQQCHHNAQTSTISTPEDLFSPASPKYGLSSYK